MTGAAFTVGGIAPLLTNPAYADLVKELKKKLAEGGMSERYSLSSAGVRAVRDHPCRAYRHLRSHARDGFHDQSADNVWSRARHRDRGR